MKKGEYTWGQMGKTISKTDYDKKALEIVLPETIITEKTLNVLKELEEQYKNIEFWYVIAK